MKINAFANVFRLPSAGSVASKRNEGDGGSGSNQYDPNQTRKDGQNPGDGKNGRNADPAGEAASSQPKPDRARLDAAVIAFHADPATQASGLTAVLEEGAPGLRVVVKDVNGTTLRQFSGDEFLRLRGNAAAGSQDTRGRGKILDQKL